MHIFQAAAIVIRRQIDTAALPPRAASPLPSSPHDRAARAFESARAFDTVHAAEWSRTPVPAAVSVHQLTEQVIRQIDSRMIAWRERMGKV